MKRIIVGKEGWIENGEKKRRIEKRCNIKKIKNIKKEEKRKRRRWGIGRNKVP
jgi:hypothetical protein